MTSYNPQIFTQFIYDTLSGDSNVTSLVTGIYTHALQDTPTPYIVIDIEAIQPITGADLAAMNISFSLNAYSVEAGYSELFDIMEAAYNALQGTTPSLTGFEVINTRMLDSQFDRLSDGKGVRARLQFRSFIQKT